MLFRSATLVCAHTSVAVTGQSRVDSTGRDFFPGPAGRSRLFTKKSRLDFGRDSWVDSSRCFFFKSIIKHLAGRKGLLDYAAIDI